MHGIGAGPSFYSILISDLVGMDRPLFVVEMPFATMRMVEDVPEAHDTAIGVKNMLNTHGYDKAVFVSHSFGTVATTWMKNMIPSAMAGAVMIDPVCFLQNHAHVCFNFVHRAPKRLFQVNKSLQPSPPFICLSLTLKFVIVSYLLLCCAGTLYHALLFKALPVARRNIFCRPGTSVVPG
jgi:pimeloyl-ACP methyl ester carboxylesterase